MATGVATHGHATFNTQVAGTFSVGTIPSGSYGTNPTLVLALAASWFFSSGHEFDLFTAWNSIRVDNNLAASVSLPLVFGGSGGAPTYGGAELIETMATGFLDSGATINLIFTGTINTATAFYQEAGAVVHAVITYSLGDERDGLDDFYLSGSPFPGDFLQSNPSAGTFSLTALNGGTYLNSYGALDLTRFNKPVQGDASLKLAVCLLALAVDNSGFLGAVTFSGANWTTVESISSPNIGITGAGTNPVGVNAGIGLWTRPAVLDTSYNVSCPLIPFENGPKFIVTLNNRLPLQSRTRGFAQVVG